ncbi:MAG: tetratricopeptide repeat protein [Verrucomicrobiota bacterium]
MRSRSEESGEQFKIPVVIFALVATGAFFGSGLSRAQEVLDPSDIWYRGFLLVQAAEDLETQGSYLAAFNKLGEAKPLYDHLAQTYPDFQTEIVRERRMLIAEKREELKELMRTRGATPRATPIQPSTEVAPSDLAERLPSPGSTRIDGARSRSFEIDEGQEVALPSWNDGSSQALPRVGTRRQPTVGEIAGSLHSDLEQRDNLIDLLNRENQRLRGELKSSEASLSSAQSQLISAQRKEQDLVKRLGQAEARGESSSQAVIAELRSLLRDATEQLAAATKRNAALVAELGKVQAEKKKMQARIEELEKERDSLLEVVSGSNQSGRALEELMDRNRSLTEQLNRAERLASSLAELNQQKDADIAMLKEEVGRIKAERDQLLADNARHQASIENLQRKLEMLSDGLTQEEKSALDSASPIERQENELLRSMVLKQLRRQAQTLQAKQLLIEQLDRTGIRSETLLSLIDDIARGSQLTAEEKALFRDPQVQEVIEAASQTSSGFSFSDDPDASGNGSATMTATLIAPGRAPEGATPDVIREQKLSVELAQLDKAARLDFKEGRYAEAESGFLEYLRYRPRSVGCLCNLGVLKIAMRNYSEATYYLNKALAIDDESGLAHYLLGRALFLQDQLEDALASLERSLVFEPKNPKAHNSIGVISSRKGWAERAEEAFAEAVSIDPDYADAHFNLAVLYATKEDPNPEGAHRHYFRALDLGLPRNAVVEDFLEASVAAGVDLG